VTPRVARLAGRGLHESELAIARCRSCRQRPRSAPELQATTGTLGWAVLLKRGAGLVRPGHQRFISGGVDTEVSPVEEVDEAERLGEALRADAGTFCFASSRSRSHPRRWDKP
jgi:hypothetical protein